MTRIGLTQRVSVVETYEERRDCLDQAWTTVCNELDYVPLPLANRVNDVTSYLDSLDLDGIVLTSGNDLTTVENPSDPAPERDRFETAVLEFAIEKELPVLGVCRGLQLINTYFDGSLSPVEGHVATDHPINFTAKGINGDIELPSEATVNSYHEYGINPARVGDELTILGSAPDDTVEYITHDRYPLWGVMWHPERDPQLTPLDHQILTYIFDISRL